MVAWIVHVPAATIVTAVPETVQTPVVFELNVTANPAGLVVAPTVKGGSPKVKLELAGVSIVTVGVPTPILNDPLLTEVNPVVEALRI